MAPAREGAATAMSFLSDVLRDATLPPRREGHSGAWPAPAVDLEPPASAEIPLGEAAAREPSPLAAGGPTEPIELDPQPASAVEGEPSPSPELPPGATVTREPSPVASGARAEATGLDPQPAPPPREETSESQAGDGRSVARASAGPPARTRAR